MSFFSSLGNAMKSKTVWAGVGTAILGVGELGQQYAPQILSFFPAATPVGAGITVALGIITVIGRIKAKQALGPVIDDTIRRTVEAVHIIGSDSTAVTGRQSTTIPAPQTTMGKIAQLAEVTALVKSPAIAKL